MFHPLRLSTLSVPSRGPFHQVKTWGMLANWLQYARGCSHGCKTWNGQGKALFGGLDVAAS